MAWDQNGDVAPTVENGGLVPYAGKGYNDLVYNDWVARKTAREQAAANAKAAAQNNATLQGTAQRDSALQLQRQRQSSGLGITGTILTNPRRRAAGTILTSDAQTLGGYAGSNILGL